MYVSKSLRICLSGLGIAAGCFANAVFVPVTVAGTALGSFSGVTPGFSIVPGPAIEGTNQFYNISSQFAGDVGYYGISPVFNSGTFGLVTLVSPTNSTTVYNGLLSVDITFTLPTVTDQVFEAVVEGSITGQINNQVGTGGASLLFNQNPITFYYGPGNASWFTLVLNPVTYGPMGGTQPLTGWGQTYTTPAPAGALVFLVGALRARRRSRR